MRNGKEGLLLLEDNTVFRGEGVGATGTVVGEVVFNTGMTGYQEILTDPSYAGQMVTMTAAHIGNTGINPEDMESVRPFIHGFIMNECCQVPSNYRSTESLSDYLKRNGIPALHHIDTRALTRHIRSHGAMMGILSTDGTDEDTLRKMLKEHQRIEEQDLVKDVTRQSKERWKESASNEWYYNPLNPMGEKQFHVAAMDFGVKQNILRLMTSLGMKVTAVPASTSADEIQSLSPDGIFLSNGPGDPQTVDYAIETVRTLAGKYPIFGICLGHQILGLALGAKTFKLKFGHHGSNHPVQNLQNKSVEITAQNHNYAVDTESAGKAGFDVTHLNLNDGTVEGMRHQDLPVFSVQYHPEASPGPHDSVYLFRLFYEMMEKNNRR